MRLVWGILAVCGAAAQDTATYQSFSADLNGHSVGGPQVTATTGKARAARTERLQSINGRMVPLEQVTESVLRDDPSGRVVERTIQRFGPDGHPLPPEMSLIERESRAPGNTTVRVTTSRRDINGHLQITERSVTETLKTAGSESSETSIERPAIDGTFQPVEKRSVLKTGSADSYRENSTTYRSGANGFYEAGRVVTDRAADATTTTDQIASYEAGPGGGLELVSQTARKSIKHPDRSETEVVDLFGQSVPGIASTSGLPLKLQTREITERKISADGSVHEVLLVQRPSLSDPTVLATPKVVAETTCTGKCHQ